MKERILYYDFLRGIAIIAVVAIHANSIGYKFEDTSFNFMASAFIRQIVNFGVPLFLSISGYFLATKSVDTKELYFSFLKKQLPRVLIPLIIWSLFYIFFDYLGGGKPRFLLKQAFTFQASAPFYYILLIVQFYLLLPVLQHLGRKRAGLFFSLSVSLSCCILIYYIRYHTSFQLPLVLYAGNFFTWLVFFVLGIYLRTHIIKISKGWLMALCIMTFCLSLFETWAIYYYHQQIIEGTTAVKFSSFLYSFFVIMLLFSSAGLGNRYVTRIGEFSFGIYFIHMFVLMKLKLILTGTAPDVFAYTIPVQIAIVILTILICTLFGLLVRRINPDLSSKYLGF